MFCVFAEVMAQYDAVTFEYNLASFSAFAYVVLITHS